MHQYRASFVINCHVVVVELFAAVVAARSSIVNSVSFSWRVIFLLSCSSSFIALGFDPIATCAPPTVRG